MEIFIRSIVKPLVLIVGKLSPLTRTLTKKNNIYLHKTTLLYEDNYREKKKKKSSNTRGNHGEIEGAVRNPQS